ncbi:hypothetical protein [uncultured Photobacterium sp.]|uniref:hypothetical protein n=1 Tax=uncultured Photobacterium sp. TaxID=173973 RepID=UPI002611B7D5|nr:hypothetical protein [uncultured Photobacterium sp.]
MVKKISHCLSIMLFFISGYCQSEVYTVNDMIQHFNLVESEVQQFNVEDCSKIPWLQKGLCYEIKKKVISKLAEVSPYIGDNALIKRDYWSGKKQFGSKTFVTKTDVLLRVNGDTSISVNNDGLAVDDIFYPYIGRFYLNAGASGDGDGYIKNRGICLAHNPLKPWKCAKYATYKDHFDMDFFGSVQFDIIAGLTTNAKVIETPNEYILVLQPVFRLVARDSNVKIGYDVSDIGLITSISNIIDMNNSAFDMSINLAAFHFDRAIEDFIFMNESALISLAASTVLTDDLTNDAIFKVLSEITTYFLDSELDKKTDRVLYQQEKAINDAIKDKLNLDKDGLVAYHFSKSKIHGTAIAELIPVLTLYL